MTNQSLPLEDQRTAQDAARFGYMLIATVVAFVMLGTTWFVYDAVTNTEPHLSEVPVSGYEAESFYITSCSACHGLHGEGGGLLSAPPLDHTGNAWKLSSAQIVDRILNGGESMPAMKAEVRQAELYAVANYISQWWTEEQRANQPQ